MSDINKDLIEIIQDNTRVQTKSASNQEAIVSLLKEVLAALKEASVERVSNKDIICESKRILDAHTTAMNSVVDIKKSLENSDHSSYKRAAKTIADLETLPSVLKDINEFEMIKKARNLIIIIKFCAGVVAFSAAGITIALLMTKVLGFKFGG